MSRTEMVSIPNEEAELIKRVDELKERRMFSRVTVTSLKEYFAHVAPDAPELKGTGFNIASDADIDNYIADLQSDGRLRTNYELQLIRDALGKALLVGPFTYYSESATCVRS